MPSDFHQLDWTHAIEDDLRQIVRLAVREDLDRYHDWTTLALVAAGRAGQGGRRRPQARHRRRAAGAAGRDRRNARGDRPAVHAPPTATKWRPAPSSPQLAGAARDLLVCERPLLNLLGRLSGIATLTRQFVRQVAGTQAKIYDTRKTTPGWRRLEKYAVRCGGGTNHRTGLSTPC